MQPAPACRRRALLPCRHAREGAPRPRGGRAPALGPVPRAARAWRRRSDRRRLHGLVEARPADAGARRALPARPHPGRAPLARRHRPAGRGAARPALRPRRPRRVRGPRHLRLPRRGARSPARVGPSTSWWRRCPSRSSATSSRSSDASPPAGTRSTVALVPTLPRRSTPRLGARCWSTSSSSTRRRGRPRPRAPWSGPGPSIRCSCTATCTRGSSSSTPTPPHRLTGILDWQTARVDHPFVEFDLGEWGTALWRGHRVHLPGAAAARVGCLRGRARAARRPRRRVRVAPRLRPRPQGAGHRRLPRRPRTRGGRDRRRGAGTRCGPPCAPCRNSCARKDVEGPCLPSPSTTSSSSPVFPTPIPPPQERRATSVTTAPTGLRGRGVPGAPRLRRRVPDRPRPVHPHGRDGRGRVGARRRQGHVVAPPPRLRDRHLHARRHLPAPGLQRRRRVHQRRRHAVDDRGRRDPPQGGAARGGRGGRRHCSTASSCGSTSRAGSR